MAFLGLRVCIELMHHCGRQPLTPSEDTEIGAKHSMGFFANVTSYCSLHEDFALKTSFY
jgi:hypothetical protein